MTYAPFWGMVNWQQRFVCSANPNMFYFNEDGSANVNNEAGIRRLSGASWSRSSGPGRARSRRTGSRSTSSWAPATAFRAARSRTRRRSCPGNPDLDTGDVGQFIKTDVTPGRVVDGALVRRPVIFYNISYGVNAFADPSTARGHLPLPAVGRRRAHVHLPDFNPGGYQDPHHTYSFEDPYTAQSYKPQPLGAVRGDRPAHRSADHASAAAREYRTRHVGSDPGGSDRQETPEQAAEGARRRWNAITERLGAENQVAALQTMNSAFPTVTDGEGEQLDITEVSTVVA